LYLPVLERGVKSQLSLVVIQPFLRSTLQNVGPRVITRLHFDR
jgi:hypothetical protein